MKSDKKISNQEKTLLLKEENTSDLDDTFDWDWIFDREWLRTKK
jgi:hypothetical protein